MCVRTLVHVTAKKTETLAKRLHGNRAEESQIDMMREAGSNKHASSPQAYCTHTHIFVDLSA